MEGNREGKGMTWTGRALSALAIAPFVMGAAMSFTGNPQAVAGLARYGWPATMLVPVALIEAVCVLVYLLPPVSVLGAILLTGYLGGAVATHLRVGESPATPIVVGVLVWLGLFLRDRKVSELLPVRAKDFAYERSIVVDRGSEEVFAYLRMLRNFQNWNPFLAKDPNPKLEYRGTDGEPGYVASWEGNKELGAGEQEIARVLDGRRVEFELRFKKPFRATNQGYFAVEPLDGGRSRVRWGMSGKSPFPMNVIGMFIDCEAMIGKEFEAGLARLKATLEKSAARSAGR